jgi:hypothetical protein
MLTRWNIATHISVTHWAPLIVRPFRKNGISAMESVVRWFLARIHIVRAFIADSLRKYFGKNSRDLGSQRMCPFCGLITSRRKTCCLECGKSLKPA